MPKSAGGLCFLAMPLATGRRARLLFMLSCTEQQPPKRRGALLEIVNFLIEGGGEGQQPSIGRARLHAAAQLDVFFDGPERAPERIFELLVHALAEAFAIEPMSDVAAVPYEVLLLDLPQRAAAVWAGEWRWWPVELAGTQRVGARPFRTW